jgi:hypothetical protein
MSSKPNIHDILKNACEKFGLTMGEALAITKTPLHPRELRDDFAGKAMASVIARGDDTNRPGMAEWSYAMADVMLKARNE